MYTTPTVSKKKRERTKREKYGEKAAISKKNEKKEREKNKKKFVFFPRNVFFGGSCVFQQSKPFPQGSKKKEESSPIKPLTLFFFYPRSFDLDTNHTSTRHTVITPTAQM